ncbi:STAS domain-containing protein [Streptomyces sp. NPDC020875]|uniref:STAS domain-containing protein n=1 Tax=Streptomyces sp. NPDC020875 TaxID=3154898 RepID=UPI0033E1042B
MCPSTPITTSTAEPVVVRITGRVRPDDVPRLCAELTAKLGARRDDGDPTEAVCDVRELTRADLTAVDAVARLHLTARRLGCELRLRDAPAELGALLHLVGLGALARPSRPD